MTGGHRDCRRCGTVVASALVGPVTVAPTETVLCPECGTDNSTRPSLGFRWSYGLQQAHKKRLILGRWWWLRYAPWRCWMMPSEIARWDRARAGQRDVRQEAGE